MMAISKRPVSLSSRDELRPRDDRFSDQEISVLTAFAILIDGLVYAAYLFIVAIGLTLIFGVMKILNVAHGSFYTFGAYGAATAIGIYFDRGLPDAGGFLLMAVFYIGPGLAIGVILEPCDMRVVYRM